MENSFIITVRSDIGAGVSGSNQGITALLDLSTKSGIADKDCSDIYLSFDTDSLEGSISKGTGLPVNNGIMPKEAKELIGIIPQDPKVICFEITVFNPRFDFNHATTTSVYYLLEKALSVLKYRYIS